jgi:hypothetical protein
VDIMVDIASMADLVSTTPLAIIMCRVIITTTIITVTTADGESLLRQ